MTCIRQWGKKMADAGFQPLVFEDAMEVGAGGWEEDHCLVAGRRLLRRMRPPTAVERIGRTIKA